MQNRQAIQTTLTKLFDAERTVRRLHDELIGAPSDLLLDVVSGAIASAMRERDENEATLRLVRMALLLGEQEGPRAVDALIDVLTSEIPEVRQIAGEELEGLAFERFKEVAQGIERALTRLTVGSPALAELPYVIAEVPEPGVPALLGQFLMHQDADAVAAAIETLVETGDVTNTAQIRRLIGDKRTVELAAEGNGAESVSRVTLGELAEEALSLLSPGEGSEGTEGDDGGAPS